MGSLESFTGPDHLARIGVVFRGDSRHAGHNQVVSDQNRRWLIAAALAGRVPGTMAVRHVPLAARLNRVNVAGLAVDDVANAVAGRDGWVATTRVTLARPEHLSGD